ncbi:MAG: dihydrolipoamide acetyltransferase family protein [Hyphomicrobiaceae bacterium]
MKTFFLPDIGEGLQESEIVSWHVSPGDHVVADQPLVAVETDKAVVELPSPWSGTISRLCADVGDVIEVGAPLIEFDEGHDEDTGAIVGELESAAKNVFERSAVAHHGSADAAAIIRATPAVRALALEKDVDLASVRGSGPDGTILMSDVEAALNARSTISEGYEPFKGARRALAANMTRAGRTVVPATVTDLADISVWWRPDADITARTVSAVTVAARQEPSLNAWFDGETPARRLHNRIDVGLAVDAPDGLFVPVIRNCGERDKDEIRQAIDDFVVKAKARTFSPDDLRGPTITVSNFGAIAGRHASLVLMPPQVAIVGIGRTETGIELEDGVPVEHVRLPISLTFDHRAVTGGEAARFIGILRSELECGG